MANNVSRTASGSYFRVELKHFLDVCEAVNTPRSLCCAILAKHGEWAQYLELTFPDPLVSSFADDYLVTEMMSKHPNLPGLSIDRKAAAITKWWGAEASCRATNDILDSYSRGDFLFPPDVDRVINKARSIIAYILDDGSQSGIRYSLDDLTRNLRFGPGSSSAAKGSKATISNKMLSRFDVTSDLLPFVKSLLGDEWFGLIRLKPLNHNTVSFVPKNSKTDRPISVEPHCNILVQLGIGATLRKLLRKVMDLDHQKAMNRLAVGRAQKDGLVTIDLSSASDTVAFNLVRELLPVDWFALLCLARTPLSYQENGDQIHLSKFSSMGNGFTFELETLIFYALARASGSESPEVFGDDIICENDVAPLLLKTLNCLGFVVNEKKTFLAGKFFESCGRDVWDGRDVRPYYLKGEYHDEVNCRIQIGNKCRLYANRRTCHGLSCDKRFLRAWLRVILADNRVRETGVPILRDPVTGLAAPYDASGLIRTFDEFAPARWRDGFCGFLAFTWSGTPATQKRHEFGAYIAALWGFKCTRDWSISELPKFREVIWNDESYRDAPLTKIRKRPLFAFGDWGDIGPWA